MGAWLCLRNSRYVGIGESKKKSGRKHAEMCQERNGPNFGGLKGEGEAGVFLREGHFFVSFLRKGNFKRKDRICD